MSIIGTWGLAAIGFIAAGAILLFAPGEPVDGGSPPEFAGIVFILLGLGSFAAMGAIVAPLLGLDPPLPIKKIIPESRMKRWTSVGRLDEFPNNLPKEVRARSVRVTIVRVDDNVYALGGLCAHARLPLAGFPGSPLKAQPIEDNCIECPFHGARYELETGRPVRQPFSSEFNQEHPFLGRLQSKALFFNKSTGPQQTFPARVEDGEVQVKVFR
jgi:3-phenylpropionate/trans-cinnamate dioxygenase ferredoxin subunit